MLKIADVEDKTFTTIRLREGYDIAEVDRFLTDVAEAIALRDKAISELQEELAAALERPTVVDVDQERPDGDRRESSAAAARLLEMATVNADQLLADATAEADSLVTGARAEAEGLITTSRAEAAAMEARVVALRQLETEHRNRLRGHLTEQLAQLEKSTPAMPLAVVAD